MAGTKLETAKRHQWSIVVDWLYARGVKDAHVRYHLFGYAVSIPC
jgi:hypothetical protein